MFIYFFTIQDVFSIPESPTYMDASTVEQCCQLEEVVGGSEVVFFFLILTLCAIINSSFWYDTINLGLDSPLYISRVSVYNF